MPDVQFDDPRLAATYDHQSGWSIDRDFYLKSAGRKPIDILDMGCGTGLICNAYAAQGHRVTGADPAKAMLDIAKQQPNSSKISWILSDAQSFTSEKHFDLIIMTGHAFQVFQDDAATQSAFAVMRDHLKPEGRIIFESRNPNLNWPEIWAEANQPSILPGNILHSWKFIDRTDEHISFEHHYVVGDETLISRSKLRFPSRENIETLLKAVGLKSGAVLGDWDKSPFDATQSPEMIFQVTLAT